MSQLSKLEKILAFYQQHLEVVKTKFKLQANIVVEAQIAVRRLETELESTQERSSAATPTAFTYRLAAHLMEKIEGNIRQTRNQLNEETEKLETRRAELRAQMSKIEALEKVVAHKANAIEHLGRITEQHLADERYLNTHFYGSLK